MKHLKTYIFLLFLVLFASYIYYFEIRSESLQEAQKLHERLIVKIPKDTIEAIHFLNSYDQFELQRQSDIWLLTKPLKDRADLFVVDRMLDFLSKQTILQDLSLEENPNENFHFTSKDPWIQIKNKQGQNYKIWISSLVGLQGAAYLKVLVTENNTMTTHYYLASPEWRAEFDRTVLYFRDKFVFQQDMNELQNIEKWMNGKRIYQIKNTNNEEWKWIGVDGKQVLVDKDKFYEIIQELVQLSATDFITTDELTKQKKDQIGFNDVLPYFVLSLKNKEVKLFYSQASSQKTYLLIEDKIYEIFANALSFLNWNIDDYKNRSKPFSVNIAEVKSIVLTSPLRNLHFNKQGEKWSSNFAGNRFIRILTDLKVKRFLPDILPPAFNSHLDLQLTSGHHLRLSWSNEDVEKPEILMTSSKINETFLVEGSEWKKLLTLLEGDASWDSTSK